MKLPIYLDNNATTPVDPRVLEVMLPYFTEHFGNSSSLLHPYGWAAQEAVESARTSVAGLFHVSPKEVYFTSGGTESNNLALRGLFETYGSEKNHFVSSETEHKAVLQVLHDLESKGAIVTFLKPDRFGQISADQVKAALTPKTLAVSLMWANNEIGTLHPIAEIAKVTEAAGVFLHTDAVQAAGHHAIDFSQVPIDLLTLSAHKMYGPKGASALIIRKRSPRLKIAPQITGGGHEMGLRSGTLNTPAIVGLGKACEIMREEGLLEAKKLFALSERMLKLVLENVNQVELNGHPTHRLCNNLSLTVKGVGPDTLIGDLIRGMAVSTGSACLNQTMSTSHVLESIGRTQEEARSTVRIAVGRFTKESEVDEAAQFFIDTVKKRRGSI
ncbi:MAG: cysteine desulfurase [Bdellovibrionales bacterium]|nr:cysteine desulfurase [Bdellovibrionales bacterium]